MHFMRSMKIFFLSLTLLEIFKKWNKSAEFFSMPTFPNLLKLEIYGNEC